MEYLLTAKSVELNESVEYKSLPSGLHNVEEDLMYERPESPQIAV